MKPARLYLPITIIIRTPFHDEEHIRPAQGVDRPQPLLFHLVQANT